MLSYQPSHHHPHTAAPRTQNPSLSQSTSASFQHSNHNLNAKTPAPSRTLGSGLGGKNVDIRDIRGGSMTVGPKQLDGKTSGLGGLGTEIKQRNTNLNKHAAQSSEAGGSGMASATPVKMMKGAGGAGGAAGKELLRGKTPSRTEIGPKRLFTSTQALSLSHTHSNPQPQTERKPKSLSNAHKTPHKSQGLNLRGGAGGAGGAFLTPGPSSRVYAHQVDGGNDGDNDNDDDDETSPTSTEGFNILPHPTQPAHEKFQNVRGTPLPSSVRNRKRSTIGPTSGYRLSVSGGGGGGGSGAGSGSVDNTPLKQTTLAPPSQQAPSFTLATPGPAMGMTTFRDLGDRYKTPCRPTLGSGGGYGSLLDEDDEDEDGMEELGDDDEVNGAGSGSMIKLGGVGHSLGKSHSMMDLEGEMDMMHEVEGAKGEGEEGEESDGDVEYMPPRAVPLPHDPPFTFTPLPHLSQALRTAIPGDYLVDDEDGFDRDEMRRRAEGVGEWVLKEVEDAERLIWDVDLRSEDGYGFSGIRMKTELEMEEPSLRRLTALKIQRRKQEEERERRERHANIDRQQQKQDNRGLEVIAEEGSGMGQKKNIGAGVGRRDVGRGVGANSKAAAVGAKRDWTARAGSTSNKPAAGPIAKMQRPNTTTNNKTTTSTISRPPASANRASSTDTSRIANTSTSAATRTTDQQALKPAQRGYSFARPTASQSKMMVNGSNGRVGKIGMTTTNRANGTGKAGATIGGKDEKASNKPEDSNAEDDGGGFDYEALEKEMLGSVDEMLMDMGVDVGAL